MCVCESVCARACLRRRTELMQPGKPLTLIMPLGRRVHGCWSLCASCQRLTTGTRVQIPHTDSARKLQVLWIKAHIDSSLKLQVLLIEAHTDSALKLQVLLIEAHTDLALKLQVLFAEAQQSGQSQVMTCMHLARMHLCAKHLHSHALQTPPRQGVPEY